jgi:zinc transport system permease protein
MADFLGRVFEPFRYAFIWKALLAGAFLAVSCSFLGIFVLLKRQSMIGDGLAHVGFASIAIAMLTGLAPLAVTIPVVILASLLILKLNETSGIQGDAAIALVAAFSVALGVMIASLARGFNVDILSFLFGSILLINDWELLISGVLALTVVLVILFNFHPLMASAYDEDFASVIGIRTRRMNNLLAVLVGLTIALGIRIVGTMLISSLIIFPTVSALQWGLGFRKTIMAALLISVSSVLAGILISFFLDIPTGATIVMCNAVVFAISFLAIRFRK